MGVLDGIDFGFDFDMTTFVFGGADTDAIESDVWSRPVPRRPVTCAYEHAIDLARELAIDNETETFAYVSGNFVFGDLLEALVEERRLTVRSLGIQTLSMSDENIDSIRNVCEMTPVERLDLVLSDYWYAHERHRGGLVGYLFDELDMEGLELRVAFAGIHAKVTTIETLRGNVLTMQGSANLRSSGNMEQLHISPDRGLYEFCDGMTRRIIEAYDVVNQDNRKRKKSIRRAELWRVAANEAAVEPAGREAEAAEAQGQGVPSGSSAASTPATVGDAPLRTGRPQASTTTSPSSDGVGGTADG